MSNRKLSRLNPTTASLYVHPATVVWVGPEVFLNRISDDAWFEAFPQVSAVMNVRTRHLSELEMDLGAKAPIDLVVSSLFWRGGDGIEVARLLERASFAKAYRIVTPPLPRPEVVLREIRVACPTLDVDLVPLADLALRDE